MNREKLVVAKRRLGEDGISRLTRKSILPSTVVLWITFIKLKSNRIYSNKNPLFVENDLALLGLL